MQNSGAAWILFQTTASYIELVSMISRIASQPDCFGDVRIGGMSPTVGDVGIVLESGWNGWLELWLRGGNRNLEAAECLVMDSLGNDDGDGIGSCLRGIALDGDHVSCDDGNVSPS